MLLKKIVYLKNQIWRHFELLCWIGALVLLFFIPENKSDSSLCVFSALGFGKCPGCGIGHAIHFALKAEFIESFKHHPLGIFAVLVIFNRIRLLIKQNNKHEQPLL